MAARRERGLLDPDAAPGESLFDHHVYVICSDGDLEEGVSGEASLDRRHQELGNLTMIYDRNRISIEGDTDIAFTEDVAKRYEAYGWHVQVVDWTNGGTEYAEDVPALHDAVAGGREVTDKPSLHRARHDHRLARAQRPGHRQGPRQRPRRRGGRGHQEDPRASTPTQTFEVPTTSSPTPATLRRARRRRRRAWDAAVRRLGGGQPRRPRRSSTGSRRARCPTGSADALPTFEANEKGVATRVGLRQGHQRDRAADARAVGRVRRPGRAPTTPPSRRRRRSCRQERSTKEWQADPYRAACCTSASASTAWARS